MVSVVSRTRIYEMNTIRAVQEEGNRHALAQTFFVTRFRCGNRALRGVRHGSMFRRSTSQENDASADSETPTEQITPIEVVASVNQWGSLAEQIGGVHVKVTSVLSSTDVNAHDFEPKTDDIDKLQQAQGRSVQWCRL